MGLGAQRAGEGARAGGLGVAKIFVSYRRADAWSEAGWITEVLDRHFGQDKVFMDITGLELGADFPTVIKNEIATVNALIAVIGPGWVDAKDDNGNRKLEDPDDWVRLEIGNALRREIRVIPVLVNDAAIPPESKLPDDLRPLRSRHALRLTREQWFEGIKKLTDALDGVVTPTDKDLVPSPPPQPEEERAVTNALDGVVTPADTVLVPPPPPQPEAERETLTVPPFTPWTVLGVLIGAAMVLSGVLIHNSAGETALHPRFGGPANFHDSTLLWRLAGVFTTLPTLGIVVTALAALFIAQGRARSRAACGGAILLCGLQGFVLYAGILAAPSGKRTGFAVAAVGGLLLVAVALPTVYRLVEHASRPSDPPLEISARATAVLGAAVMVLGMTVNFNNGGPGPEHVHMGSVFEGSHPERWDLLLIASVAAAFGLFSSILGVPRQLIGGALVACGVGAMCIWPRFIVIPLIEDRSIASPGAGGFIGLAAAALILFSGYRALRGSEQERPAAKPRLA
jgi:TIR domain